MPHHSWKYEWNANRTEPCRCSVPEAMRQLPKERSFASSPDIPVTFVRKKCPKEAVFITSVQLAATSESAELARKKPKGAIT